MKSCIGFVYTSKADLFGINFNENKIYIISEKTVKEKNILTKANNNFSIGSLFVKGLSKNEKVIIKNKTAIKKEIKNLN